MTVCRCCGTALNDNDTVCPKCGNHINGDTNSEVKERNNISPSELTEDSAVSDKTILDRLYTDHASDNTDYAPAFTETEEFEKSAEDFRRLKRMLLISLPTLLFLPLFFVFYLCTLIFALHADFKACSFMQAHRTSLLFSDLRKLCFLHFFEILCTVVLFAMAVYGYFFEFSVEMLFYTALLLELSCYFSWDLVLKTSEKFKNKQPEIPQSNPVTSSRKKANILKIYGLPVIGSTLFFIYQTMEFYYGIDFNRRRLPQVAPILHEYKNCLIDKGVLDSFEEGKPVTGSSCHITPYSYNNISGLSFNGSELTIEFRLPHTSYTVQPYYSDHVDRTVIWKALPSSECAKKYDCLSVDPNTL